MKKRNLRQNTWAISVMYDAVFFIVMVSLSGAILLPALQSDVAVDSSIDRQREHIADDALNTMLVSRIDHFEYRVAGDIINNTLPASISQSELYKTITTWLIGRDQLHKTYANLIAEDLGCQFKMPFSILGNNRFNFFTGEYDEKLKTQIENFLDEYLGEKYDYQFSAVWHPIKGVDLGGDIEVGNTPPKDNCYVSKSFIMMPFRPAISVNNVDFVLSKYWIKNNVIRVINCPCKIDSIVKDYQNNIAPYDNQENATRGVQENLSELLFGILVDGVYDSSNNLIFPGIVDSIIGYGLQRIKDAVTGIVENAVNNTIGEALGTVDSMVGELVGEKNPLFEEFEKQVLNQINNMLGGAYSSLENAIDMLIDAVSENVTRIVKDFIEPYIQNFIDTLFEDVSIVDIHFVYNLLNEWIFDRISINKAEVTLSVWGVR